MKILLVLRWRARGGGASSISTSSSCATCDMLLAHGGAHEPCGPQELRTVLQPEEFRNSGLGCCWRCIVESLVNAG
eukprot:scaffold49522_cov54-Phaeocystis_antarctica.AAC.2